MRVPRRAFTLIELMVVMTIIALLAGLMVAGTTFLRERAKITATSHRMEQVKTGLQLYSTGGDLAEQLQRLAGFDRRLVSLRSAMSLLVDQYGLDIVNATKGTYPLPAHGTAFVYPSNGQLPPGLGNRWENLRVKLNASGQPNGGGALASPMASRPWWTDQSAGLENVVTFMDRQISRDEESGWGNSPISYWPNLAQGTAVGTFWMVIAWDDVASNAYYGPYGSTLGGFNGGITQRRGTQSSRGETLNDTLEIRPDQIRPPRWYAEQWPNLVERLIPGAAGEVLFVQDVYEASDWDQDVPGTRPVAWHWPWGRQIFSRKQGKMISQIEYKEDGAGKLVDRTLADLNPLSTMLLLQAAGVLPAGTEGQDLYRGDRGTARNWNDAWGGPLVVVNAMFFPARYDFDDVNDGMANTKTGVMMPRDSRSMLGGRDFFFKQSETSYGFTRSFYAAVGAAGTGYRTLLPDPWSVAEDPATLRTLWRAIREKTDAAEWTGRSFTDPAWTGVRNKKKSGARWFVTTPAEIK